MDIARMIVTVVGLTLIVWVNWYFFLAGKRRPKPGP